MEEEIRSSGMIDRYKKNICDLANKLVSVTNVLEESDYSDLMDILDFHQAYLTSEKEDCEKKIIDCVMNDRQYSHEKEVYQNTLSNIARIENLKSKLTTQKEMSNEIQSKCKEIQIRTEQTRC